MKRTDPAFLGLCIALSLILSYVESLIPWNIGVPGIKMGLPNLVIVFILYRKNWKYAALMSFIRVILVAVLFGNLFSFAYSMAGAVFSLLVMALLKKTGKFKTLGVSVSGGICHNMAQIVVAIFLLSTKELIYYLPALTIGGIISGILIGAASSILVKRVPKLEHGKNL